MRGRKQPDIATTQDMRTVLQLTEDEFMALWEKRWLRANGRPREGVHIATISLVAKGLRNGEYARREDIPKNLPKGSRPR